MDITTTDTTQATTYKHSGLKITLAFLTFILIGANDGAVGVLLPGFGHYYHIDKSTVSLLFLASTFGYLIASFNIGMLMQKLGNWPVMLLGCTLLLISTGTLSFTPPFFLLLLSFFLVGMGVAIVDSGLNIFIASLPRNTSLLNYLHAFYGLGAWLGPIIATTLLVGLNQNWNSIYMVWFAITVLLFTGFILLFRDWRRAGSSDEKNEGNLLLSALKLRVVWFAALFLLVYVGAEVSMGSWSYSFLTQERHGSPFLSGWVVSGYWLGLMLGRVLLGKLSSHIGDKRLIEGCLLGVIAGVLLVWFSPFEALTAAAMLLMGFSLGPIFPTTIALMSRLVTSRLLATVIGFMVSLGSMGAAIFPWLVGNMAQHFGLWTLLPFLVFLTVMMFILWLALQRRPAY